MRREESIQRIRDQDQPWDVLVIGGGATGIGIALDAATRGLDVLLLERFDFGKGTSSRSTKLVHGGVRYLAQGNITLVRDALRERGLLMQNAPHLVSPMSFVIPCRSWWRWLFYGLGLKVYDLLASGDQFARSKLVTSTRALELVSTLSRQRLRGGVTYQDGQFDDAKLLIGMACTASRHGACLANYVEVTALRKNDQGQIVGVNAFDEESDELFEIAARQVVNAAGPFCDEVRRLDDGDATPMLATSQGVHIVLPKSFLPGDSAIIVPKTSDGRVIFLIPWQGHVVVGTTDTPIPHAQVEPTARDEEIRFLLHTAGEYLDRNPTAEDILSVFTGIRPLVQGDPSARTASLSRDHVIRVSDSGLMTITGGKWTTVRKMAEDCVDKIAKRHSMEVPKCRTQTIAIDQVSLGRATIENARPDTAETIHPQLEVRASEVIDAVRGGMARTVEDVLARRTRILFLNAQAAIEAAPKVASILAEELGRDQAWVDRQVAEFSSVAQCFLFLGRDEDALD